MVTTIEIHETNPHEPVEIEVCDDFSDEDFYDPKFDDSDKSDDIRESMEYHQDRE